MTAAETMPEERAARTLPLVWATHDNIAPFGQLLGGDEVPNAGLGIPFYKGSVIEGGNIDFQYTGRATMRCARILPGGRDAVVWLERHMHMTQLFVPLGLEPFAMVLAPPNHERGAQTPDIDTVTAFAIPPGHALLLHIGTWHDFPIAPAGPITILTMNSDEVVEALRQMPAPGEMDFGDVFKIDVQRRTGAQLHVDLTLPA
jgi:ureidoglycolate lyase